jgi:hypothetical protein
MMISAEMALSFTPRSPPPRITARPMASTTTAPACTAPTPTKDTSRSARATPSVSSTARRRRERGPLLPEYEDGQKPGHAGGNGRLKDLQPCAPEADGCRVQTSANYRNYEIYPPVASGFSPLKRSKMRRTSTMYSSADTTKHFPPLLRTHWGHHTTPTKLGDNFP